MADLEVTCTNEGKKKVTLAPQTGSGKPASVDGALRLSVVSGNGSIAQDPDDALSVFVVSEDDQGDTELLVEGDSDLSAGESFIPFAITLHTIRPSAKSFTAVVSEEVPK